MREARDGRQVGGVKFEFGLVSTLRRYSRQILTDFPFGRLDPYDRICLAEGAKIEFS